MIVGTPVGWLAGAAASLVGWPGPLGLTLDDLAQVACREPDPAPVQVEGHLPAVGAGPEGALGHLVETKAAENLGRPLPARSILRKGERVRIMSGHCTSTGVQGRTWIGRPWAGLVRPGMSDLVTRTAVRRRARIRTEPSSLTSTSQSKCYYYFVTTIKPEIRSVARPVSGDLTVALGRSCTGAHM